MLLRRRNAGWKRDLTLRTTVTSLCLIIVMPCPLDIVVTQWLRRQVFGLSNHLDMLMLCGLLMF